MDYAIEIKNVSKKYRRTVALDNVSLNVPVGTVFALLGENGAGKTTLIQNILGLTAADTGSVSVLGQDPKRKAVQIRRQVGYVPDSPALYDWMTVEQIAWFSSGFYSPHFFAEFEKLASEFQLDMSQKIKNLSKGGKAKVALALSMAHQPELLILDEPTSGLDTLVRRHFLESMIDVASEGRTVFLSSHQIVEVERVAEWVAIINQGQVLACDTLENLKANFERWVVTIEDPQKELTIAGATVVNHEGKSKRRQQFVVRDCDPNALWQIRDQPGVLDVEVHPPTLEEVFIALMRPANPSSKVEHSQADNTTTSEGASQ